MPEVSGAMVALYLTQETGLPCNTRGYEVSLFRAPGSGRSLAEMYALRLLFQRGVSIKQQCRLLSFGSDPQRCDIVLEATEASPVHCKVYAQFNSSLEDRPWWDF